MDQRDFEREVARMLKVPDTLVGISSPWWRRLVQRWTRRP